MVLYVLSDSVIDNVTDFCLDIGTGFLLVYVIPLSLPGLPVENSAFLPVLVNESPLSGHAKN